MRFRKCMNICRNCNMARGSLAPPILDHLHPTTNTNTQTHKHTQAHTHTHSRQIGHQTRGEFWDPEILRIRMLCFMQRMHLYFSIGFDSFHPDIALQILDFMFVIFVVWSETYLHKRKTNVTRVLDAWFRFC